jgi:hypothetical protein
MAPSAQVLFEKRNLRRGSPARELEPTVAYRLGVDIGWWETSNKPGNLLVARGS